MIYFAKRQPFATMNRLLWLRKYLLSVAKPFGMTEISEAKAFAQ